MKKVFYTTSFCFFSIFASLSAGSQQIKDVDENKYRIDLPDFWKPGNKIWAVLNDKLPVVAEELKDKQLCGDDCNPKYIVAFEMTKPIVADRYLVKRSIADSVETWTSFAGYNYSFRASLLLFKFDGELIRRYDIVDTNEVWRLYPRATNEKFRQETVVVFEAMGPIPDAVQYAADLAGQNRSRDAMPVFTTRRSTVYKAPNPDDGIIIAPTIEEMFKVVDRKMKTDVFGD